MATIEQLQALAVEIRARDFVKAGLHSGLSSESLIEKLATAPVGTDPWSLDLTDQERKQLGAALAGESATPTLHDLREVGRELLKHAFLRNKREIKSRLKTETSTKKIRELIAFDARVNQALQTIDQHLEGRQG